jgi:hypothetical protein
MAGIPSIMQRALGKPSAYSTGRLDVVVRTNMFFDRQAVKDALRYMNFHALSRGSLAVRRIAQKSIKKRGAARPPTKIETLNGEVPLSRLADMPGLPPRTRGALIRKLREIKTRPPSAAGTPPHTHVASSHMLGFRRNLYNAFDSDTQSAVIGPMPKGDFPRIPQLHEYGGNRTLQGWMYQSANMRVPLVRFLPEGETPNSPLWKRMKQRKNSRYPARPFMNPALRKAIQTGKIAAAFKNAFGPFRGAGGDYAG